MCPHCSTHLVEADQAFCATCGHDLRQHLTRCTSCGWGYHPALLSPSTVIAYCAKCGKAMPVADFQAALNVM